jgi:sigma-B regulation protein RsbQ
MSAFVPDKYASLQGYADDVIEIVTEADIVGAVFVGHSVSAMIGALASIKRPDLFSGLIMVSPSPRYIDDREYVGGFSAAQVRELLEFLDSNHLGWSAAMAPVIMGNADRPRLGEELTNSFCRTDPEIAKHFARTLFTADNRADLPKVCVRTLILQCSNDVIAPVSVGEYMHRHIRGSDYVQLQATGHCPNLSAPDETTAAIRAFL